MASVGASEVERQSEETNVIWNKTYSGSRYPWQCTHWVSKQALNLLVKMAELVSTYTDIELMFLFGTVSTMHI
jgi:hypothetical protein